MSKLTIYGCFDDLIEIEGDFEAEFYRFDTESYLHFADGTVLRCKYNPGDEGLGWRILPIKVGTAMTTPLPPWVDGDGWHLTDVLELEGDLGDTVRCWGSAEGPTPEDMTEFWDDFSMDQYPADKVLAAYRALTKE